MSEYSRILGDVVKVAREKAGLTQAEVAASIDRDSRTVLNIENYKGNPKLEVLYPLVRALKIDSREIFNPEMQLESPALRQLQLMVAECSEAEADAIIPVVKAAIDLVRNRSKLRI
ncbi:MAG: helix-turn-helix domain-containing protein [Clostridiales bacterium]|jgi:DNA-binding XRE family transcriptional regulator|nr:helix-turn-helix domain-containing protein [Clostridiales bacterium]MCI7018377.1 helix-turn-helix domain-containing protein [Clostridiales bacterium]